MIVAGIDDQFDADLASFISYADENDGYKYLLIVIDIFSRYAWVQPLKDKGSNEVINAFDKILQEGRKPKRLRTDAGREFSNNSFQEYLETKNIVHFTTHSAKTSKLCRTFH